MERDVNEKNTNFVVVLKFSYINLNLINFW